MFNFNLNLRVIKRFILHIAIIPVGFLFFLAQPAYSQTFPGSGTPQMPVIGQIQGMISDSLANRMEENPDSASNKGRKGHAFIDKIEELSDKNFLIRELHNIVVVPARKKSVKDTLQTVMSENEFMQSKGKIIRKIILRKMDVFGPSVYDTTTQPTSWIQRTGNRIHVKTRDWVLKENILFKEGQPLDPYVLADNERIIRELPSIEDANFVVREVPGSADSVDVIVIAKDVWSIGFQLNLHSTSTGDFDFWDRNILGTGHEFQNDIAWDTKKTGILGYSGYYRVRNLGGSFIDGRLMYSKLFETGSYGISLARNFFIENIKYAGGLEISHIQTLKNFRLSDSLLNQNPVRGNVFGFWTGRSFPVKSENLFTRHRSTITLTGGIYWDKYSERPLVSDDAFYNYFNKTLVLFGIGFSEQNFYKSNLIYSFGRTEDVPYGSLLRFTGGYEWNEFGRRFYAAYGLSKGNYVLNLGYLYTNVEFGGFIANNRIDQGILNLESDFFTNLFVVNNFYFRHFFYFRYTAGIHSFRDEWLDINTNNGIRGYVNPNVLGEQRMLARLESVMFTPWYLIDFRIAPFGFADIALIGPGHRLITLNPLYSGIGGGVRVRNERLVFNTLQLGVGYYPRPDAKGNHWMFLLSGETRLVPRNFFVKAPSILRFN